MEVVITRNRRARWHGMLEPKYKVKMSKNNSAQSGARGKRGGSEYILPTIRCTSLGARGVRTHTHRHAYSDALDIGKRTLIYTDGPQDAAGNRSIRLFKIGFAGFSSTQLNVCPRPVHNNTLYMPKGLMADTARAQLDNRFYRHWGKPNA